MKIQHFSLAIFCTITVAALFFGGCSKDDNLFTNEIDPVATDTTTIVDTTTVNIDTTDGNGGGNNGGHTHTTTIKDLHGEYCGPATCEMRYYDAWGNYQYQKTFEYKACLIIGDPATMSSGEEEDNPFNLIIGPETGHGLEGRLFLTSGQGVGNTQVQAMMNYWQVDWQDGEISGELTDTHSSQASIFNTLQAYDQWTGITLPKYVATETTLEGTLDEERADIRVKGGTTDGIVRFTFTLDALRD
ncbi:MAG: hypothetical protein KDD27_25815 [Saprospiraceae bacterium]|nr:hypothetical protein [Saprospiraceae bacterium]